ncbi:MAG: hypothetical protein KKH75_06570, partial [Actinobacteria bacterium]|nr:hypothetical protein [Actinomycetota bacterium]
VTAGDGGVVSLQIGGIDLAQTGYLLITSPAGDTTRVDVGSSANASVPSYRVGSNTQSVVTVTPYSRFAVPSGLAGSPSGSARTVTTNGIGRPLTPVLTLTSTSNGDGTSTISASGSATPNGDGSTIRFGIVAGGDPSPCTVSTSGASALFTVLDGNEFTYSLCAESWLGSTSFGRSETSGTVRAVQSGRAPRGYTFVVAAAPDVQTGTAYWRVKDAPTSTEPVPRNNRVEVQGLPSSVIGADPGIQVRYVHTIWGTATAWSTATAAPGSAPYQVRADWSVRACTAGSPLATTSSSTNAQGVSSSNNGQAAITIDTSRAVYTDAAGTQLTPDASGNVPAGATSVTGLTVSVDWSAQGWGLNPATDTFGGTCTP